MTAGLALWWFCRRRRAKQRSFLAASFASGSVADAASSKGLTDSLLKLSRAALLTVDGLKALQAQQRSLDRSSFSGASHPSTWTISSHGLGSSGGRQLVGQASERSLKSVGSSVDIKPWLLPFADLELHDRVGEGSYGVVSIWLSYVAWLSYM